MKRKILYALIGITLGLSAVFLVLSLRYEYQTNTYVHTQIEKKDYQRIYQFYAAADPLINSANMEGNASAPITIITVLDFMNPSSESLYTGVLSEIRKQYVETGQVRLYYKYYLTREEFNEKKGRFIYVAAVRCYTSLGGTNLAAVQRELFSIASVETKGGVSEAIRNALILALTTVNGVDKDHMNSCILNSSDESIANDVLEAEQFRIQSPSVHIGIDGQNNIVFVGDPSFNQIHRAIRQKQIALGI
jgi:hypothetical protein